MQRLAKVSQFKRFTRMLMSDVGPNKVQVVICLRFSKAYSVISGNRRVKIPRPGELVCNI